MQVHLPCREASSPLSPRPLCLLYFLAGEGEVAVSVGLPFSRSQSDLTVDSLLQGTP